METEIVVKISKESIEALNRFSVAASECGLAIDEFMAVVDAIKKRYGILWPILLFFARMERGER